MCTITATRVPRFRQSPLCLSPFLSFLSVPYLRMQYLKNAWKEFLLIWHKCPFGLSDEMVLMMILVIKGQAHYDLTNRVLAVIQEFIC